MDSAILSLLGAFVLSLIGLFAFIWSLRQGLLVGNPKAAAMIFAPGEIGRIDDPSLPVRAQASMQSAVVARGDPLVPAELAEIDDRVVANRSSSFPVFMFLASACFWLLVGSMAGLVTSIKLHQPDWLVDDAWLSFGRIRTINLCSPTRPRLNRRGRGARTSTAQTSSNGNFRPCQRRVPRGH